MSEWRVNGAQVLEKIKKIMDCGLLQTLCCQHQRHQPLRSCQMYSDGCAAVAHDSDHNSSESFPQFGAATSLRGRLPTPVAAWQPLPPRSTIPVHLCRGTWRHPPGNLPNLIPVRLTLTLDVNSHHCY